MITVFGSRSCQSNRSLHTFRYLLLQTEFRIRIRWILGLPDPDPLVIRKKNLPYISTQNVPAKSNKQKKYFLLVCQGHWWKDQDPEPDPPRWSEVRIRGSRSLPQCHGSGTLITNCVLKNFIKLFALKQKQFVKILGGIQYSKWWLS